LFEPFLYTATSDKYTIYTLIYVYISQGQIYILMHSLLLATLICKCCAHRLSL